MAKKSNNQLYWLGPGDFGHGKDSLKPNDPLPDSWDDKKIDAMKKRFPGKIGEKVLKGTGKKIESFTAEIEALKERIEILESDNKRLVDENNELINQIESGGKK